MENTEERTQRRHHRKRFTLHPGPANPTKLKLAAMFDASFSMSENTLYEQYRHRLARPLQEDECIMFLSLTKMMVMFVWAPRILRNQDTPTASRTVVSSYKHRITAGQPWNPLALDEYAKEGNIEITNFKDFATAAKQFYMRS